MVPIVASGVEVTKLVTNETILKDQTRKKGLIFKNFAEIEYFIHIHNDVLGGYYTTNTNM